MAIRYSDDTKQIVQTNFGHALYAFLSHKETESSVRMAKYSEKKGFGIWRVSWLSTSRSTSLSLPSLFVDSIFIRKFGTSLP